MNRPSLRFAMARGALAIFAALLAACGDKKSTSAHGHSHDAPAPAERAADASFKAGHGLQLAGPTAAALGVQTVAIAERPIAPEVRATANVFDAGPPARASALVPPEIADDLERHPPADAKVLSVRRDASSALARMEIVLGLPGSRPVGTTYEFIVRGAERLALAVPRSAVLRSATGTFIYVTNGAYLLRTAVKTGAGERDFIEITDGLYPGDIVVIAGVEQLWLTELRLTKGGGHSH